MTRWMIARIRRRYRALWVNLTYMEVWSVPRPVPTWCVWVYDGVGCAHDYREVARSRSRLLAVFRAWRKPLPSTP